MKNKDVKTRKYKYVPEIISTSDLQRRSGRIINMVKESTSPYFVVRNNKTEAVILNVNEYERLNKMIEQWEMKDALTAVEDYKKAKGEGKLKRLKGTVYDLWKELQNENDN